MHCMYTCIFLAREEEERRRQRKAEFTAWRHGRRDAAIAEANRIERKLKEEGMEGLMKEWFPSLW